MSSAQSYDCRCLHCLQGQENPDKVLHRQMNLFLSRLDEQQRRWYIALESKKLGHGGDKQLSLITGMHVETIRRGRRELDAYLKERPVGRVRLAGGGRPAIKKNTQT